MSASLSRYRSTARACSGDNDSGGIVRSLSVKTHSSLPDTLAAANRATWPDMPLLTSQWETSATLHWRGSVSGGPVMPRAACRAGCVRGEGWQVEAGV